MRYFNRKGQFVPLTSMILMTAVLLMVAGVNIYRLSKAKLQVQNLADAASLALASMEAKAVNTVVDRDEWLNHMYGDGYNYRNGVSIPKISSADGWRLNKATAQPYANLVASINKAQWMFKGAYDNFLGAGGNAGSNGSGNAALGDILSEIDGLQDPSITAVWVYNSDTNKPTSQQTSSTNGQAISMDVAGKLHNLMQPLTFNTVDVTLNVSDGKPKQQTLTKLAGASGGTDEQKVGWVRPDWDAPANTMQVQVSKGSGMQGHWAVGVTVVKQVQLFLFGLKQVQATSLSFVDDAAGQVSGQGGKNTPPASFRPTYFARLAYHS